MDIIEDLKMIENSREFTKKQKSLAAYILVNHVRICFLSLSKACEEAKCSEVTFLNFCKKIGYKNFIDLKKDFRKYTESKISILPTNIKQHSCNISTNDFYQSIINSELDYLNNLFEIIDVSKFVKISKKVIKSRYVIVLGHHWSNRMGQYLQSRLSRLKLSVILVDPSDLVNTEYIVNNISKNDFVFFFSFPAYFYGTKEIARLISKKTAKILLITDSDTSPASQYIEEKILCKTHSDIFDNTWIAPLSLVDIITNMIAQALNFNRKYNNPSYNQSK